MSFLFDYFNQFETPNFALANPNGDLLYPLGGLLDRNVKLRFNALSELTFTAYKYSGENLNPWYDLLDYRRLVDIENLAVFMITDKEIKSDGIAEYKVITCKSREVELNFKKLTLFKGSYFFYDYVNPAPTLLGKILDYIPGWTIAHVDADLTSLNRSFDVTDVTIYNFLMNQVSQSFQCIFKFDTINKTISAYTVANATSNSDIFLSHNNLIENINIKEITEELVTALTVYGGGDLSINQVNPLGTNTIYNFSFYKTTDWMSADLISALTTWEALVASNQETYANYLTSLKANNVTLLAKESELTTLQGELDALLEVQTVRIRQGLSISAVNAQINAKKSEMTAKQSEIDAVNAIISGLTDDLTAINDLLSFPNNFTSDQLIELNRYIIGSTYTNPNFIQTDIMSLDEIQDQAQTLYNQAQDVLAKIAEPRYSFEVDSANFVFLKEFQTFIDQLELGCVVTVETGTDTFAYPALLGIDYSYDDPNAFKLTFSNRLRLDDSAFQFSDLFAQAIDSGITTSVNSEIWSSWDTYSKNSVTEFITSALNAANNMVTSGSNQEFIIDAHGLRGRYLDPGTGQYDDKQVWLINNLMAFTRDNWDTASLALGEVMTPSGVPAYGLVADVLVGRLVAGNELLITNDQSTFSVSGSSATMTNGNLFLTRSDENSKINIDPNVGIEILRRESSSGSYVRNFYVDQYGNIVFTGTLQGANGDFTGTITAPSGKIGAWSIDQFGFYDIYGNYIYGNGNVRLGKLTINGSNATFDGNIYARNLQDYVYGTQIRNINADTITAGTISGINIYGARIYWPGAVLESGGYGLASINAYNNIAINAGSNEAVLNLTPQKAELYSYTELNLGTLFFGKTRIRGDLETIDNNANIGWGMTADIPVSTPLGDRILHFVNGILSDPNHYATSGSISSGQVYPGTFWVAAGAYNAVANSSDGVTWTDAGSLAISVNNFDRNASLVVGVGINPSGSQVNLVTSSDGLTWNSKNIGVGQGYGIFWDGSKFLLGSAASFFGNLNFAYSSDGITWNASKLDITGSIHGFSYGNGVYVMACAYAFPYEAQMHNSLAYSSNGLSWTGLGETIFSQAAYSVCFGNGMFVAAGQGTNTLAYSSDGQNWTGNSSMFSISGNAVCYGNGVFVAVGNGSSNTIAYSTDGQNWNGLGTSIFGYTGSSPYGGIGVSWNGSQFVASGYSGITTQHLAYSNDGINWSLGTNPDEAYPYNDMIWM